MYTYYISVGSNIGDRRQFIMGAYAVSYTHLDVYKRQDVEQAKELIKEAGYDENHPLPPITILYNTSEMHKAIAEAIQATWHKAFGADVRLQNQETKVFLANREAGKYQVARASWVADYGDPQNFLEVFSAEDNDSQYHSEEYNELIARIRSTPDSARCV